MSAVESVTTRRPLGPNGVTTKPAWDAVDRFAHVSSLFRDTLELPGEEGLLCFLLEAISDCWLPPGWEVTRDQFGQCYFANRLTGEATWSHPLAEQLRELAGVYRLCMNSEEEVRDLAVDTLLHTWQEHTRVGLEPWKQAVDSVGVQCYQHQTSRAVCYMDPAGDVLPQLYIRSVALRKLRSSNYRTDRTEEIKALVGPLQQHLLDVQMRQQQHQRLQLEQKQQQELQQLRRLHTPNHDASREEQQQMLQQQQMQQQQQQQQVQQQQQELQQGQQGAHQHVNEVQQVQQQQVQQLQQQMQQQMQQQVQQHQQQSVVLQQQLQLLDQLKRQQDEERDELQQQRQQVRQLLSQSQEQQQLWQQPAGGQQMQQQQPWKRSQVVPYMQQDETVLSQGAGDENDLRIVSPDGTEIVVRSRPRGLQRAGRGSPSGGPAQPLADLPVAVPRDGADAATREVQPQQQQWPQGWSCQDPGSTEPAFLPGGSSASDAAQRTMTPPTAGQVSPRLAHSADRAAMGLAVGSLGSAVVGPDQAAGAVDSVGFK